MYATSEETASVKLEDESTTGKDKNIASNIFEKDDLIDIKTPPFKTSSVCLPSSLNQLFTPIYTKSSSPRPENQGLKSEHPHFKVNNTLPGPWLHIYKPTIVTPQYVQIFMEYAHSQKISWKIKTKI